jgi:hypothetical protein
MGAGDAVAVPLPRGADALPTYLPTLYFYIYIYITLPIESLGPFAAVANESVETNQRATSLTSSAHLPSGGVVGAVHVSDA